MGPHAAPMNPHRFALLAVGVLVYASMVAAVVVDAVEFDPGAITFIVGGPVYSTVGIIILLNRPGHRIGRLLLLLGIGLTITAIGPVILELIAPLRWAIRPLRVALEFLVEWSGSIAAILGTILMLVWFPDGRAKSRLGQAIVLASLLFIVGSILTSLGDGDETTNTVVFILVIALYLLSILELGIRTVRASPRDRAPMRWVFGSAAIVTVFMIGVMTIGSSLPFLWGLWINSTILPAIAVAIAISRHHLYDIDRLISRSIAYALVTAILFVVFAVVNLSLQNLLGSVVRGNAIAVAVSTLVVASLFQPLRMRLQQVVDRRINRGHYDAARTVESYASRLRNELDLVTLTSDLQHVTSRTVEPAATSVWLRSRGRP
jgi:hypothetical protein